jgi:asparagine synthase (glutamine-hydrolysing)
MAAWGIEARVPFLAREMLDLVMTLDPTEKMSTAERMEKHILRQSFEGYLPAEVLWRQKEQFSDGVGYSWIDALRDAAEQNVTDKMLDEAKHRFPVKTPLNKEGYWYRTIFEELFPAPSAAECVQAEPSIACSTETALRWDSAFNDCIDPSGRAVKAVHQDSY